MPILTHLWLYIATQQYMQKLFLYVPNYMLFREKSQGLIALSTSNVAVNSNLSLQSYQNAKFPFVPSAGIEPASNP